MCHPKCADSLGKAQQAPELALVIKQDKGIKQESLSVSVCPAAKPGANSHSSMPFLPLHIHHLSQLNLPAGSPRRTLAWPSVSCLPLVTSFGLSTGRGGSGQLWAGTEGMEGT